LENSGKQVVGCFLFVTVSTKVSSQIDAIAKIGLMNFAEQMVGTQVDLIGITKAEN